MELTVQIDSSRFYQRALCALVSQPLVFSPTRAGVRALQKWAAEIAPSCEAVFLVDVGQPFGAVIARALGALGYRA